MGFLTPFELYNNNFDFGLKWIKQRRLYDGFMLRNKIKQKSVNDDSILD